MLYVLPRGAAASLSIPRMEIFTHGVWEEDALKLRTLGDIEINLEGGVKFSGELGLRLWSPHLENLTDPGNLIFKNAVFTAHDILGLPLDLTFFVGEKEQIGEGAGFVKYFSDWNFATDYSGHLYFNESSSDTVVYKGLGTVSGTGVVLSLDFGTDFLKTMIYTFQDSLLAEEGYYTSILRGLLDLENVKLEAYLSASYPQSDYGLYSAGLMFYFRPAKIGSFYTQIGIPRLDLADMAFNLDLFYFLFEPRVQFGPLSVNLTFLLRPAYYLNLPTNEEGNMDVNLNILIGQMDVMSLSGGIEATAKLNSNADSDPEINFFTCTLSPYFGVITSGVVWNFKFKYNILKNDTEPMFEGYIGVKAEL